MTPEPGGLVFDLDGTLADTVTDADLLAECDRQLIGRAADVPPIAPVVDILRRAHGRVPLAPATGSTTPVATAVLATIGLDAARAAGMSVVDVQPLVRGGFPS